MGVWVLGGGGGGGNLCHWATREVPLEHKNTRTKFGFILICLTESIPPDRQFSSGSLKISLQFSNPPPPRKPLGCPHVPGEGVSWQSVTIFSNCRISKQREHFLGSRNLRIINTPPPPPRCPLRVKVKSSWALIETY